MNNKVIHTKNNYDLEVFNGEIGFICDVTVTDTGKEQVSVQYSDKEISYKRSDLGSLDLAYALTVHKMQGSECPLIIMPIFGTFLSKNAIYTALTQAKQCVVLIGGRQNLMDSLGWETALERKSNLMKRLQTQILHMTFEPGSVETDTNTLEAYIEMAGTEQLTLC